MPCSVCVCVCVCCRSPALRRTQQGNFSSTFLNTKVFNRAVSVNALIYAINAAAINAIKYFNAINATLKKTKFECLYLDSYEVMTGSDAEKRWGEDWEITSGPT